MKQPLYLNYPTGDLKTFLITANQETLYENLSSNQTKTDVHARNTQPQIDMLVKIAFGIARGLDSLHKCRVSMM